MLSNLYTVDFGEVAALFTFQVVFLVFGYIFSASFEIWGINWLKSVYRIELALFSAMLLNAYWPIQYILYRYEVSKLPEGRVVTAEMYRSYAVLGGLAAAISVTRCYGIVSLPPLLYVITANTEICWESLMTYFILGRHIDRYQKLAVLMVIAGMYFCGFCTFVSVGLRLLIS
jgi:drug/metabolite transporter (DMT)-like permease